MKLLMIGAGNMGSAMLSGLHKEHDVTVVEAYAPRRKELADLFPDVTVLDEAPIVDEYVVILAVKPQSLDKLDCIGEAEAVISILAGTPLAAVRSKIAAKAHVRAMPNLAALKHKSITSLCGDVSFQKEAEAILASIGQTIWLDSEEQLDIATGIGASAPAWIALVAEALSDGAVNIGLPRDKSYRYVAALMDGMGALLADEHPAIIKDKVTSPGGTTIAGLTALEEGAVRDSFIRAVEACYERTKELS